MLFTFKCNELPNYKSYHVIKNAFTLEECDKIHDLFPDNLKQATIGAGEVNPTIRKTSLSWLGYSQEVDWIYQKLTKLILPVNDSIWRFQLTGFQEALQLTSYNEGDHYDWHLDSGPNDHSKRKLSFVLQLSQGYEGCELQFIDCRHHAPEKDAGSLIIFPSYVAHRVTELTKNSRRSLVGWISGEPYR